MNLGQYIAQQLLEAEDKPTIALFPGAFKPPHKFIIVERLEFFNILHNNLSTMSNTTFFYKTIH